MSPTPGDLDLKAAEEIAWRIDAVEIALRHWLSGRL